MNKSSCILLLVVATALVANGAYLGKNENGIDVFSIDMNLDAKYRFQETSAFYKEKVTVVLEHYLSLVPDFLIDAIAVVGQAIQWIQPEYYEEINGMAFALGLDTPYLMFIQYVYEFSAFCTSSVVRMQDGTIIHDRNLDFAFADVMRNVTYIAKFMKGDQYLYDGVMFAGYNGVMTGIRKGAFSISLNERKPSWRTDPIELIKNLASLFAGYQQNTKVIRDTLETCTSYDCAYKALSETYVIAPSYFIVAGLKGNEGAVITRDRFTVAHLDELTDKKWFVLQTNDDHWTGVCTARCSKAIERIQTIGQDKINATQLRDDVLLQWPNLNLHSIYNAIMIPSSQNFEVKTVASDLPDPDAIVHKPKWKKGAHYSHFWRWVVSFFQ